MPTPATPSTPSAGAALAAQRDLLRRLATGTAGVVGDAFFRALVRHLAEAFGAELAFVGEHLPARPGRIRLLASWQNGVPLPEGHEFDIDDTMPCAVVVRDGLLLLPEGACAQYPNDEYVSTYGLDAYLGMELPAAEGGQVGYLAVMSSQPIVPTEDEIAVLRIFLARAAAEIERRRHQMALRDREREVAAARSRVLDAADSERQRIGRDLHDGAQQRIVALGHLIGIARRKLGDDVPADAAALLERAYDEARLATDELRELARGLHPAGLTEKGLGPALEALAERSPLRLTLARLPERRLPGPVELTAFYLASEGLTNAIKYAGADEVRVEVYQRADTAIIVVADDGKGGADASAGSGLAGLRDRVAALGGELKVESPAGRGTRLEASIPLGPWRSAQEPFLEFGHPDDGGRGEQSIQDIIAGRRTVSVTLAREWELEGGVPRIGQLLPIMDHHGRRRATVEVTRVLSVPFSDIDDELVDATQLGQDSLESWRNVQRRFYDQCRDELALLFGEPGWRFADEQPMVLTWYRTVEGHGAEHKPAGPGAGPGAAPAS